MIWRKLFSYYFLLFFAISIAFCAEQQQRHQRQQKQQDESTVWLIRPEARSEEKTAGVKRLPEAMCPTRRSKNDVKSQLQSGAIAEIQWQNPQKFAPESSKIELIAAESNSILARLDPIVASESPASADGVASKLVRIPENFDCKDCILRLTVETNDQSQIVSCADVQISTQNNSALQLTTKAECATDAECGGHGECYHNSCYCKTGFYGPNCSSEGRHNSELTAEVESSKYHAFTFPSQSQFLWRVDSAENAIEMALKIPTKQLTSGKNGEWFILGVRPEDEASKAKCMKILSTDANANVRALGVPVRHNSVPSENSVQIVSPSVDVKPVPPPAESAKNSLKIHKIASSPSELAGCGENETFSTCPEHSRQCDPSCDWTAFPESIPSCPKACGQPRCICKEGFVRLANDRDECRPFSFCQAAEVVQECARNETWAKCGRACEPSCESMYNVDPCMDTCQTPACTCADNFVRFNGQCIFWGSCPNLEERFLSTTGSSSPTVIGRGEGAQSVVPPKAPPKRLPASESSTISMPLSTSFHAEEHPSSKTTPQSAFVIESAPDAVDADASKCAANETVNECGRVCEADCVTIFVRGECNECASRPACACRQGFARHTAGHCVYWNDCPLEGSGLQTVSVNRNRSSTTIAATTTVEETTTPTSKPTTKSAAKTTKKSAATTEKPTKTTGIAATATGITTTVPPSLASAPGVLHDCFGEWVWPSDCTKDCDYKISWIYTPETDLMDFALEAKVPPNWWTGVGFSASGSLAGTDLIAVRSQNGGVLSLHDLHVDAAGNLREDKIQNVFPSEAKLGTHANGILRAKFSRRRATDESGADFSFGDDKCFKFLFPVSGGRLTENGSISTALSQPHVTTQEICVRACPQQASKQSQQKASPPPPAYSCQTEYRFPDGCEADSCEYRAKWALNPLDADVEFQISAKGIGRWTGIGFSQDGQMANSDIYTGWVYDHRAYVTDRFSFDRQMPAIDGQNDIYNVTGSLNDDVQTISFRRKVVTKDNTTDFPLDRCYHFLFPVGGGRVMARHGDDFRSAETPIGYHDQTPPEFSAKKICLCVEGVPLASEYENGISAAPATVPIASTSAAKSQRRARRQIAASATAADDAFVCSDIALIELRDGGAKIRVSDAFALSKRAIMTDAFSFVDVSTQIEGDTLTVLMRKLINESEPNDFSIADGPATIYLGSGHGVIDFDSATFPIELTRVNLVHPETYASSVPQLPATESTATNFVDFSTSASDGPFDVANITNGENGQQSSINNRIVEDSTTIAASVDIDHKEFTTVSNVPTEIEAISSTASVPSDVFTTPSAEPAATSLATTSEKPAEEIHTSTTMTDANCFGGFEFPEGCSLSGAQPCQYTVAWTANSEKKSVDFQLSATTAAERWTGIGFSPDGAMTNADVIIVSISKDSTITVTDQYSAGYGRPRIDEMQDVFNAVTSYVDGRVLANFSRSLNTGDSKDDVDLLTQCQRFIFLHTGGDLEGGSEQIRKHLLTPISSRAKICLGKCGLIESMTTVAEVTVTTDEPRVKIPTKIEIPAKKKEHNDVLIAGAGGSHEDEDPTATVVMPPSKPGVFNRLYDVVIRLVSEKWSSELEDSQSERYVKLAAKIKNALSPAISSRWPSMKEIRVMKFAEGSVLSLLQIEFDGENSPSENELKTLLAELITNDASSAAALNIDKEAMQVRENTQVDVEDKWGPLRDFGVWVIVGVVLVISMIIFVLCMACICKRSTRRKNNRKSTNSFSPHYAYQYTSSGYPTGITNAAYVGGIPSSKDTDVTKTTGSSSVSSGGGGGKKSDKSPQNAPKNGRYDMSEPGMGARQTSRADCPRGMGETTYQEWFAKVASKDAPSNYQESAYATPPIRRQLGALPYGSAVATPVHQSYVTYPNDPTNYYTLNGEHKLPPPSYYHRH